MPVKEAIIKNDMTAADEEKKKIEADQRIRQKTRLATGAWKDAQFFQFHSKNNNEEVLTEEEELERGVWEFKNNFTIDQEYITSMIQEAEQLRAKREAERVETEEPEPEPDSEDSAAESQDTCSVQ